MGPIQPGDAIIGPKGEKASLKSGGDYFLDTYRQGVYQRQRGRETDLYARNLTDANESDLRTPAAIELQGSTQTPGSGSALFTFWPYLLLASLLLFFIEWFINPPLTVGKFRRGSRQAV